MLRACSPNRPTTAKAMIANATITSSSVKPAWRWAARRWADGSERRISSLRVLHLAVACVRVQAAVHRVEPQRVRLATIAEMNHGWVDRAVGIENRVHLPLRDLARQGGEDHVHHVDRVFQLCATRQAADVVSELREIGRRIGGGDPVALLVEIVVQAVGASVQDGFTAQEAKG